MSARQSAPQCGREGSVMEQDAFSFVRSCSRIKRGRKQQRFSSTARLDALMSSIGSVDIKRVQSGCPHISGSVVYFVLGFFPQKVFCVECG